jgi:hypothetical protein
MPVLPLNLLDEGGEERVVAALRAMRDYAPDLDNDFEATPANVAKRLRKSNKSGGLGWGAPENCIAGVGNTHAYYVRADGTVYMHLDRCACGQAGIQYDIDGRKVSHRELAESLGFATA